MESLEKAQVNGELEQRLAALKARKEEIENARAERAAASSILDQVEAAELAVKDAEALAKAEEEVGALGKKIAATYTPNGVIIVRRPHTALFKRFQDAKEVTNDEVTKLVRPSLVYPDRVTFDQWIEEYPAALTTLGRQCCDLSGMKAKEAEGK